MDRIEIEVKLSRDRAWLLERLSGMSEQDLQAPRTASEHDATKTWSHADHFIHTTLIERSFNEMIRRHLDGGQGMTLGVNPDGTRQGWDEIMATVHRWTEAWADEHRGRPFGELVAIGLEVRAETMALLASLTDDQLAEVIPGAPWSDGTVGGILAVNADHGRQHFAWAEEGTASSA